MLAGMMAKWDRLQFRCGGSASHSGGGGTTSASWNAALVCRSVFNVVLLNTDLSITISAGSNINSLTWAVTMPGLSLSVSDTTEYADECYILADFYDVDIYCTFQGQIFFDFGTLVIQRDGTTFATLGGGSLASTGVGQCYVPVLGLSPLLTGNVTADFVGPATGVFDGFSILDCTVTGGWRFRRLSTDAWLQPPITLPTPIVPDGADYGSVTATDCWNGQIVFRDAWNVKRHIYENIDETPYYWEYSDHNEKRGGLYLLPNYSHQVKRLGDAGDYLALIQRAGMPKAVLAGSHTFGPVSYPPDHPVGTPPPPPPWYDTHSAFTDLRPRMSSMLGLVGNDHHVIEDPLDYECVAPCWSTHAYHVTPWIGVDPAPAGSYPTVPDVPMTVETASHTFPYSTDTRTDNPAMLAAYHWDDGNSSVDGIGHVVRYVSYWGAPLWSYWYHAGDWDLEGDPAAWEDYWAPARTQYAYNGVLPSGENTHQRTSMVSAPGTSNGLSGLLIEYVTGKQSSSWWGISRFQAEVLPTVPSLTLDSTSLPAWSSPDSSATISSTDSSAFYISMSGTATLDFELGQWSCPPYMYPLGAASVSTAWDLTDITSIEIIGVGIDGTETVLLTSVEDQLTRVSVDLFAGASTKYAGDWAQDYGCGFISDIGTDSMASGISATVMANAELSASFELATGRSYKALRFKFHASGSATAKLWWPRFDRQTECKVVPLTGQSSVILYEAADATKGGPAQHFGRWRYYDYLADAFISGPTSPSVIELGLAPSVGDYLAWRREALQGIERSDGLATEVAARYDPVEYTMLKHLWGFPTEDSGRVPDTHAFLVKRTTEPGFIGFIGVMVNSLSELPPLQTVPHQELDDDLQPTGDYTCDAYAYDFKRRRLVVPGDSAAHVSAPGGGAITTVDADQILGWTISSHDHAVDNTELLTHKVTFDGEFASVSPWHGYFAELFTAEVSDSLDYAVSRGWTHARAFLRDGELYLGFSNNVSPFSWDDRATGLLVDSCQCSYPMAGGEALWLCYAKDGQVKLTSTRTRGATFTVAITIGSGNFGAIAHVANNTVFVYRLSGGTVFGQQFDGQMNQVGTEFTTNLTGLDDKPIAARSSVGSGGELRIGIQHNVGGSLVFKTSRDGKTFS